MLRRGNSGSEIQDEGILKSGYFHMTGPGSAWDRQHALAELRRCGKCWWRSPLSGNAPHQENASMDAFGRFSQSLQLNCPKPDLPLTSSARMRPIAVNMARRPLLSSLLRMSASYMPRPRGSPKLPGSLVGSSCQTLLYYTIPYCSVCMYTYVCVYIYIYI